MHFLITDESREVLARVEVPADDPRSVVLVRADRPDILIAAADLHQDGSVTLGHWPDGEHWQTCLETSGTLPPVDA